MNTHTPCRGWASNTSGRGCEHNNLLQLATSAGTQSQRGVWQLAQSQLELGSSGGDVLVVIDDHICKFLRQWMIDSWQQQLDFNTEMVQFMLHPTLDPKVEMATASCHGFNDLCPMLHRGRMVADLLQLQWTDMSAINQLNLPFYPTASHQPTHNHHHCSHCEGCRGIQGQDISSNTCEIQRLLASFVNAVTLQWHLLKVELHCTIYQDWVLWNGMYLK